MTWRVLMRWKVVGRLLLAIYILATLALATQVTTVLADDERIILNIPFRSQFDGSYYAGANCGPATMGMILEGFGQPVSTAETRALANKLAGSDAWDGVYIYNLAGIPEHYGLQLEGLYQGSGYHTWTADDIRQHIRKGHVVVPEVRYRFLPGHEGAQVWDDHYIAIFGLIGDSFVYHDSAFQDGAGAYRTISESQLKIAMGRSDFPNAAFAVVPPPPPPPTPSPIPSPTPTLSAPGYGELMPAEAPPISEAAQLVPAETLPVSPAPEHAAEEPHDLREQELSSPTTNPRNSLPLQMGLTLAGLLSLATIGVAVSRRW